MKKIHVLLTIAVLFSVVLSACGIAAPPPTPTAQPSDTPLPASTPTPAPTDTPIPTDTPTLEPTLPPADTSPTGACVISTDKTYGYTQENPIKVGSGGFFDGPARERAYLDNLAGPNGEPISYNRTGSLGFGETILDAYVISGLGADVTLYIDEYSFTEPQAPVGFTCRGAFSLTKP